MHGCNQKCSRKPFFKRKAKSYGSVVPHTFCSPTSLQPSLAKKALSLIIDRQLRVGYRNSQFETFSFHTLKTTSIMRLALLALWTLLSFFASADEQCQTLNSTGSTIEGIAYNFYCSQWFPHYQYLQITYQENISTCLDFCRRWDEPGTVCEGVQLNRSMTGAPGFQGQLCYLLFNTTGANMSGSPDTDIALQQNSTLSVIVIVVSADYRSQASVLWNRIIPQHLVLFLTDFVIRISTYRRAISTCPIAMIWTLAPRSFYKRFPDLLM
jgi:hypothetical protein